MPSQRGGLKCFPRSKATGLVGKRFIGNGVSQDSRRDARQEKIERKKLNRSREKAVRINMKGSGEWEFTLQKGQKKQREGRCIKRGHKKDEQYEKTRHKGEGTRLTSRNCVCSAQN